MCTGETGGIVMIAAAKRFAIMGNRAMNAGYAVVLAFVSTVRTLKMYQCKDCGGKLFCVHMGQRHRCKECGGKSFCEHGKIKNTCK